MRKRYFPLLLLLLGYSYSTACTNFIVGKSASTDGSTIVSYAADSYGLFGELYHFPAAIHPDGALRDIYDWDSGRFHGQIREAHQTYNVIGNTNEYQVTIGETTFGGRPELMDSLGIVDYGSLIYIALQRSRSAGEAIKVMTTLVAEYGYCSEGETFTIADPNEVWMLEMVGKGPGMFSGVQEMLARTLISIYAVPLFGFSAICFGDVTAWIAADLFLIPAYIYVYHRLSRIISSSKMAPHV